MNCPSRGQTCGFLCLILVTLTPGAVRAADDVKSAPAPGRTLVSLDFAGGTAADYVLAIRNTVPDANIVLTTRDARELKVPALQLRSVTPSAAAGVLAGDYPAEEGKLLLVRVEELGPLDDSARPVFKVSTEVVSRRGKSDVAVWSLAGLISPDLPSESILTAVEASVALVSEEPPAKVRFHEGTSLLLFSGTPTQREAIDQVVRGLRQGVAFREQKSGGVRKGDGATGATSKSVGDVRPVSGEGERVAADTASLAARVNELEQLLADRDRTIQELEQQSGRKSGK